ncbi:hypothetical protein BJ170DRAFT_729328 [Xylariales sp. AK1849]|nr:hypothetical protein BJ170DRAFT_729328 [Xylariales sp. AK1849]
MACWADLIECTPEADVSEITRAWAEEVVKGPCTSSNQHEIERICVCCESPYHQLVSGSGRQASIEFIQVCENIHCLGTSSDLRWQAARCDLVKDVDPEDDVKCDKEEILGLSEAFDDIHKDGNAHWAVAAVLEDFGHHDAGLVEARQALDKFAEPARRFQTLVLLANIQMNLDSPDLDTAFRSIAEALSNPVSISHSLLRNAYVTQAKIQAARENLDDAVASYEEARRANPDEPLTGDILQDEFLANKDNGTSVDLVKKWTLYEQLAWMTWEYDDDDAHHFHFQKAAIMAGESDFVVKVYNEVIDLLDHFDAGVPLYVQLARWYYLSGGTLEAAKAQCLAIVDSDSNGQLYHFTNEDPSTTLIIGITELTDIIYEQDLTYRRLARAVTVTMTGLIHRDVVLARMARKVGPSHDFQDMLDTAFGDSHEALLDNVAWNDAMNLNALAEVLSNLDRLERDTQILLSAQFSKFDTASDDEDDDDEDDDAESLPDDEGDLTGKSLRCDGVCTSASTVTILFSANRATRSVWSTMPVHLLNRVLCTVVQTTSTLKVKGWRGIKDGNMMIKGEEPVKFQDWLNDLKREKVDRGLGEILDGVGWVSE